MYKIGFLFKPETLFHFVTDINLGEQWLQSMGAAAEQVGMNIQYCMSLPRHVLQALQIPRVTHARASADYAVYFNESNKITMEHWNNKYVY